MESERFREGFILTDCHSLIQFASADFTKITGYELQELVGRDCRLLQGAYIFLKDN